MQTGNIDRSQLDAKMNAALTDDLVKQSMTRLAPLGNPRSLGEALKGSRLGELWKYRVGDFRIIASIEDAAVTVVVVRIGNRREVYRRR